MVLMLQGAECRLATLKLREDKNPDDRKHSDSHRNKRTCHKVLRFDDRVPSFHLLSVRRRGKHRVRGDLSLPRFLACLFRQPIPPYSYSQRCLPGQALHILVVRTNNLVPSVGDRK